jgi:SDR family mycofactocin-dependent oxidoreductase
MGRLDGKVAFISGAARGQGRSHAVRLASEGADIIAFDVCAQIDTVPYALSTEDDLAQTVEAVEALDRRIVVGQADVRDKAAVQGVFDRGIAELGRVDIVLANAGVASMVLHEKDPDAIFRDTMEINLFGARNTIQVAAPTLIEQDQGGAIVLTSSTQGLTGRGGTGSGAGDGYVASKHGVVGLMRSWAVWLAPHNIRVNSVHPTGVNTPMIVGNEAIAEFAASRPDIAAGISENLLPTSLIEPEDVSAAIAWLVSDDARYITGVTLPVDAGFVIK